MMSLSICPVALYANSLTFLIKGTPAMSNYHTQEYPNGYQGEPKVTTTTDRKQAIQNTIDAMARAEDRMRAMHEVLNENA